jgi:hypothetical protein
MIDVAALVNEQDKDFVDLDQHINKMKEETIGAQTQSYCKNLPSSIFFIIFIIIVLLD